ncbi:MAG: hypothetical protein AAFU85_26995 [Planctomycetota bacterium]
MQSSILNVFPGLDDGNRLVLAHESDANGVAQLVLRQETRSEHVGWFVQSRIVIEPEQVAALKMTLTSRIVRDPTRSAPPLRIKSALAG